MHGAYFLSVRIVSCLSESKERESVCVSCGPTSSSDLEYFIPGICGVATTDKTQVHGFLSLGLKSPSGRPVGL